MIDISINQEGCDRITLSNKHYELLRILVLDIIVYVSNRGIILTTMGAGEVADGDNIHLNWGSRLLQIGDTVDFYFQSGEETTIQDRNLLMSELELVSVPKCVFHVSSPSLEKMVCGNADCDLLQFELRWNNISNNLSMEAWSGNMLETGEISTFEKAHRNIGPGEQVTLEIQALTNGSSRRKGRAA